MASDGKKMLKGKTKLILDSGSLTLIIQDWYIFSI